MEVDPRKAPLPPCGTGGFPAGEVRAAQGADRGRMRCTHSVLWLLHTVAERPVAIAVRVMRLAGPRAATEGRTSPSGAATASPSDRLRGTSKLIHRERRCLPGGLERPSYKAHPGRR
jgi:hypothetical protein